MHPWNLHGSSNQQGKGEAQNWPASHDLPKFRMFQDVPAPSTRLGPKRCDANGCFCNFQCTKMWNKRKQLLHCCRLASLHFWAAAHILDRLPLSRSKNSVEQLSCERYPDKYPRRADLMVPASQ